MSVLVTGGDGFVGQHLIAALLAGGRRVSATTVSTEPAAGTLDPDAFAAARWYHVDVGDPAGLERTLAETDPAVVFHLAGFSSGAQARGRVDEALAVNAGGTLNLMSAAHAAGLRRPRFVIAGSADAYGGDDALIDESMPLRPRSLYGTTKAAQDVVARGAGRALGFDVRVARLFPLIGPGQGAAFVLPSFCRRALRVARGEGEPRLRVGNLDVERDYTDVRDGVDALIRISNLAPGPHHAYNVCSGRGTAVGQLLTWVLDAAGIEVEITVDPSLLRDGEPERLAGDPKRLQEAAKWRVERDLRETVRETYRWVEATSGDLREPGEQA